MNTQILFGVVIVPAVIGLTEVAKDCGIPSRYAPAIAVLLGILAGMAQLYSSRWPWIQAIVMGVALGLSAVGLYSGVTSTFAQRAGQLPATTTSPTTDH